MISRLNQSAIPRNFRWCHGCRPDDAIPPFLSRAAWASPASDPAEDVGGAPGYAEFLAAIADPRHAEHQRYRDWRGGSFDAARFDREAVNRVLEKIRL
ncbi:MAG: IS1096 element passenger TnpR family protein [Steroidobacteraceae bacterium]